MSQQRRNPFGPHGQLGGITPNRMSPAPGRASPAGYPVGYAGYAGYQSPGFFRGASPSPSEGSSSGSGIMLAIRELADEQERVQKKTFTNWINTHLSQYDPPMHMEELFEDIKDGVRLLCLLEVLSGERLPKEKGARLRRLHFLSNVKTALDFLERRRIKLVNINPADVVDGKPAIVLGLIWTIILYFQIEENARMMGQMKGATSAGSLSSEEGVPAKKPKSSALEKFRSGAKKAMLQWAQKSISKNFGIEVKDFGRSWRDGYAFNALIHRIRPELVDMSRLSQQPNRVNLENAFSTAETHLGIPRLLDPEDVDVDKPDEKSVMTYVAQFVKSYPDPDAPPVGGTKYQYRSSLRPQAAHTTAPTLIAHHSPVPARRRGVSPFSSPGQGRRQQPGLGHIDQALTISSPSILRSVSPNVTQSPSLQHMTRYFKAEEESYRRSVSPYPAAAPAPQAQYQHSSPMLTVHSPKSYESLTYERSLSPGMPAYRIHRAYTPSALDDTTSTQQRPRSSTSTYQTSLSVQQSYQSYQASQSSSYYEGSSTQGSRSSGFFEAGASGPVWSPQYQGQPSPAYQAASSVHMEQAHGAQAPSSRWSQASMGTKYSTTSATLSGSSHSLAHSVSSQSEKLTFSDSEPEEQVERVRGTRVPTREELLAPLPQIPANLGQQPGRRAVDDTAATRSDAPALRPARSENVLTTQGKQPDVAIIDESTGMTQVVSAEELIHRHRKVTLLTALASPSGSRKSFLEGLGQKIKSKVMPSIQEGGRIPAQAQEAGAGAGVDQEMKMEEPVKAKKKKSIFSPLKKRFIKRPKQEEETKGIAHLVKASLSSAAVPMVVVDEGRQAQPTEQSALSPPFERFSPPEVHIQPSPQQSPRMSRGPDVVGNPDDSQIKQTLEEADNLFRKALSSISPPQRLSPLPQGQAKAPASGSPSGADTFARATPPSGRHIVPMDVFSSSPNPQSTSEDEDYNGFRPISPKPFTSGSEGPYWERGEYQQLLSSEDEGSSYHVSERADLQLNLEVAKATMQLPAPDAPRLQMKSPVMGKRLTQPPPKRREADAQDYQVTLTGSQVQESMSERYTGSTMSLEQSDVPNVLVFREETTYEVPVTSSETVSDTETRTISTVTKSQQYKQTTTMHEQFGAKTELKSSVELIEGQEKESRLTEGAQLSSDGKTVIIKSRRKRSKDVATKTVQGYKTTVHEQFGAKTELKSSVELIEGQEKESRLTEGAQLSSDGRTVIIKSRPEQSQDMATNTEGLPEQAAEVALEPTVQPTAKPEPSTEQVALSYVGEEKPRRIVIPQAETEEVSLQPAVRARVREGPVSVIKLEAQKYEKDGITAVHEPVVMELHFTEASPMQLSEPLQVQSSDVAHPKIKVAVSPSRTTSQVQQADVSQLRLTEVSQMQVSESQVIEPMEISQPQKREVSPSRVQPTDVMQPQLTEVSQMQVSESQEIQPSEITPHLPKERAVSPSRVISQVQPADVMQPQFTEVSQMELAQSQDIQPIEISQLPTGRAGSPSRAILQVQPTDVTQPQLTEVSQMQISESQGLQATEISQIPTGKAVSPSRAISQVRPADVTQPHFTEVSQIQVAQSHDVQSTEISQMPRERGISPLRVISQVQQADVTQPQLTEVSQMQMPESQQVQSVDVPIGLKDKAISPSRAVSQVQPADVTQLHLTEVSQIQIAESQDIQVIEIGQQPIERAVSPARVISQVQPVDVTQPQFAEVSQMQLSESQGVQATEISLLPTDRAVSPSRAIFQAQATDVAQPQLTEVSQMQISELQEAQTADISGLPIERAVSPSRVITQVQPGDVSQPQFTEVSQLQVQESQELQPAEISQLPRVVSPSRIVSQVEPSDVTQPQFTEVSQMQAADSQELQPAEISQLPTEQPVSPSRIASQVELADVTQPQFTDVSQLQVQESQDLQPAEISLLPRAVSPARIVLQVQPTDVAQPQLTEVEGLTSGTTAVSQVKPANMTQTLLMQTSEMPSSVSDLSISEVRQDSVHVGESQVVQIVEPMPEQEQSGAVPIGEQYEMLIAIQPELPTAPSRVSLSQLEEFSPQLRRKVLQTDAGEGAKLEVSGVAKEQFDVFGGTQASAIEKTEQLIVTKPEEEAALKVQADEHQVAAGGPEVEVPDVEKPVGEADDQVEAAKQAADLEQKEYNELLEWLKKAEEQLQAVVDRPVHDRQKEYKQYREFGDELKLRCEVYERFKRKSEAQQFLVISEEKWVYLKQKWCYVTAQARVWRWKLDSNLPSQLGQLGDWIHRAEELLDSERQYQDTLENNAKQAETALQQHKSFFKDLEGHERELKRIKESGTFGGQVLPRAQLEEMYQRLMSVAERAPKRQRSLEWEACRFRMEMLLTLVEKKLPTWNVKYGKQPEVEEMLTDYVMTVENQQLRAQVDDCCTEAKKCISTTKLLEPTAKAEIDNMEGWLGENEKRWTPLKVELSSTKTMLEEVVNNWRRYNTCIDLFTVWLDEAERSLQLPPDQIGDVFDNLDEWQDKLKVLNESGNFLIETTTDPVAAEIKQQLLMFNRRWKDASEAGRKLKLQGEVDRGKRDYQYGVSFLESWLEKAEHLAATQVRCDVPELTAHINSLDTIQSEEPQVEEKFKAVSKAAQELIQSSPQQEVNAMLAELKVIKDRLVKVRKDSNTKVQSLRSLLPHVESLEIGISDLSAWVAEGEALLKTHKIDGNINTLEERLEKHVAHFGNTPYFKGMLDSKNKVYQKILKSPAQYIDRASLDNAMKELNDRFKNCVTSAKEWEDRLQQGMRLWRNLQNRAQGVEEWVQEADDVLSLQGQDTQDLINKHKKFFEPDESHLMKNFQVAGDDLLKVLDPEEQQDLRVNIDSLQERWQTLTKEAPARLHQLEFVIPEDSFKQQFQVAEQTIQQEQQQLDNKGNVQDILNHHKAVFEDGGLAITCNKCLDQMKQISDNLQAYNGDKILKIRYEEHLTNWKQLELLIGNLQMQLQQVPEKWREYHTRLAEFVNWMDNLEQTINNLEKEGQASKEYKDTLSKFEAIVKDIDGQQSNAKWLSTTLDDLVVTSSPDEAATEQARLTAVLERYQNLMPVVEITTKKSSVVLQSYEYKEVVEQSIPWLSETNTTLKETAPLDDLQAVKVMLDQQEGLMAKISAEEPTVHTELQQGQTLAADQHAPQFLQATVQSLQGQWGEVTELAKARYETLKESVVRWENFEKEKAQVLDAVKKAEAELSKAPPVGGQDAVVKDIQTKQEILAELKNAQPLLEEVDELSSQLSHQASETRQRDMQQEVAQLTDRLQNSSQALESRLAELDSARDKWNKFYQQLDAFSKWLEDKKVDLDNVHQSPNPEEQYQQAQELFNEITAKKTDLEQLEKLGGELAQGYKTRESAALQKHLASLRKQWEDLCERAGQASNDLSANLSHWQKYQQDIQLLVPWLQAIEKRLEQPAGKTAYLPEAAEEYSQHQTLQQDINGHQEMWEQLQQEALYIQDHPELTEQLQHLEERWDTVCRTSQQRGTQLVKALSAWTAYDEDYTKLQALIDKLCDQTVSDPNLYEPEVLPLEQQLTTYKVLCDKITAQQPLLEAVNKKHEKLAPYLNDVGTNTVIGQCSDLDTDWRALNQKVKQRSKDLEAALEARRNMYTEWNELERWLSKAQKKLRSTDEVYSDEVSVAQGKLQTLHDESCDKADKVDSLGSEVESLCAACPDAEKANALQGRVRAFKNDYDTLCTVCADRIELCKRWQEFAAVQKQAQSQVKAAQHKLESADLDPEQVSRISNEVVLVMELVQQWQPQLQQLVELMNKSGMTIKDRSSHRLLAFDAEILTLTDQCNQVLVLLEIKQRTLVELGNQWNEFDAKKSNLLEQIRQVEQQAANVVPAEVTLPAVKDSVSALRNCEQQLQSLRAQYNELHDQGRQLMMSDNSRMGTAQEAFSEVESALESCQNTINDKLLGLNSIVSLWQQYSDSKSAVNRVLADASLVLQTPLVFNNQPEIKETLQKYKRCELDVSGQQRQMDAVQQRGQLLVQELQKIPLDDQRVKDEIDGLKTEWSEVEQKLQGNKALLEEQIRLWEAIEGNQGEIVQWLDPIVVKLQDCVDQFATATNVPDLLHKYKSELPQNENDFQDVNAKLTQLQELNDNREVPSLSEAQQNIDYQFARAAELASQLEGQVEGFQSQKSALNNELEDKNNWLKQLKERLSKADDVTGSDEDILQRLNDVKVIHNELEARQGDLGHLQEKIQAFDNQYQNPETASLGKDMTSLAKKYDAVLQKAEKVEAQLSHTVEQHVQEAEEDQQRWLQAANEKVAWCDQISGDKYSIEAKLATVQELMASVNQGEGKTQVAVEKVGLLKSAKPQVAEEVEVKKSKMQDVFQAYLASVTETKNKLEQVMQQWQGYDQNYETLSNWVKETEGKVRAEVSLQPNLETKQQQLDTFKNLCDEVSQREPAMLQVHNQAQEISKNTGDNRTANYAAQLQGRFQKLQEGVTEGRDQAEEWVDSHSAYIESYKAFQDWLNEMKARLSNIPETSGEKAELQDGLAAIKELLERKEEGQSKFSSVLDQGEKVLPQTATSGKDQIRQELRDLREQWESYLDGLNEAQRRIDALLTQWAIYEERHQHMKAWLADMQSGLSQAAQLKSNLLEKKAALQHYKSLQQDIASQASVLDADEKKGQALKSPQVNNQMKETREAYNSLVSRVKDLITESEQQVEGHQNYSEMYHQCRDWLQSLQDKLDVCSEPSPDKNSIQTKLNKLSSLENIQLEGEPKLDTVRKQADEVMPQTSSDGQEVIRQELDSLQRDWDVVLSKLAATSTGLQQALSAWQEYDDLHERLVKWIKEMEGQIKDCPLKSTLQEKEAQLEKLMAAQHEITSKKPEFEAIEVKTQQLQIGETKMTETTAALNNRYDNLHALVEDVIKQWKRFVTEHQQYQSDYNSFSKWLNDQMLKLASCSKKRGDKAELEDVQSQLNEIYAEKQQETPRLQKTMELGEALYPNTTAEGREIVRQELRSLQDRWETFCDQLSETQRSVEMSLLQWSSFDDNCDQLSKWLGQMNSNLDAENQLKATLNEKKTQLQNHKVQHQAILSHLQLVDSLEEKGQSLQASQDSKVLKMLKDMVTQYNNVRDKSSDLLKQYEDNVEKHKQYSDTYQAMLDWLASYKEKLGTCTDKAGDRYATQNKIDRLSELEASKKDGDNLLSKVQNLSEPTLATSSAQGKENIHRELDTLNSEWTGLQTNTQEASMQLQELLQKWINFEETHSALSDWMRNMEVKVKEYDLKSTLEEKEEEMQKWQAIREEVIGKQTDLDAFAEMTQQLMAETQDTHLGPYSTQLASRYQALLLNIQELVGKWERMHKEHGAYRENYMTFTTWLTSMKERLDSLQDITSRPELMTEKHNDLQALLVEKDQGQVKLTAAIESGDKLYPDTATPGREKIRQQLRTAKDVWDSLQADLVQLQQKVDNASLQWSAFKEGQDELDKWMLEVTTWLDSESNQLNTLPEKRTQLQNYKALQQDVTSHRRMVDSVVERAHSLLRNTENPDIEKYIKDVQKQYDELVNKAKEATANSEDIVQEHTQFDDSHQTAKEWLTLANERLQLCSDLSGDKHVILNKRDRVQDLVNSLPEGHAKVVTCLENGEKTIEHTGPEGVQVIKGQMDELQLSWDQLQQQIEDAKKQLDATLDKWQQFDTANEKLSQWLRETERKLKDTTLLSTSEEKKNHLAKVQELDGEIVNRNEEIQALVSLETELYGAVQAKQGEVDQAVDQAQELKQLSTEPRLAAFSSQVATRYANLQQLAKDTVKKHEQNVRDHEAYLEAYAASDAWLREAKDKYAKSAMLGQSQKDLTQKQALIQGLVDDKDNGLAKLNAATEAGEKLYSNTAADGREMIRQELRNLKADWDALFDEVTSAQRNLEVKQVELQTFEENCKQLAVWLDGAQVQLGSELPLKATLEEKKAQLLTYKNVLQDVLSYQRVLAGVSEKAESLSEDPSIAANIQQMSDTYNSLCALAKERVNQYESFVSDHQEYQTSALETKEWLSVMKEKLASCTDSVADKHSLQMKIDKLNDIAETKVEGEGRIQSLTRLSGIVRENTAPVGQELLDHEIGQLTEDWQTFLKNLEQTKVDLNKQLAEWTEFEEAYEANSTWLKAAEQQMKEISLKATLDEKKGQLDKVRTLNEYATYQQTYMDQMLDRGQAVTRSSGDPRVANQASQLISKYHSLCSSVKELMNTWERYVSEHKDYESTYHDCEAWLDDLKQRLESCSSASGDKFAVEGRLAKLAELQLQNEEGSSRIKKVNEMANPVLPGTSTRGKDIIQDELDKLRKKWELLVQDVKKSRQDLESTVSRWQQYTDAKDKLVKVLSDLEQTLHIESALQSTLPDKQAQLNRVQTLCKSLDDQHPVVVTLQDNIDQLVSAGADLAVTAEFTDVLNQFEDISSKMNDLKQKSDLYCKEHAAYQKDLTAARDWLTAALEKLTSCSDSQADPHGLKVNLETVKELDSDKHNGEQRLEQVKLKADEVIPHTAVKGQELVQHEVNDLRDQYKNYFMSLLETQGKLGSALEEWEKLELDLEKLLNWIKENEAKVKANQELQTKLDDKQGILDQHKNLKEEIQKEEPAIDQMSERAQALLGLKTDSTLSSKLTKLNSKYSGLGQAAKDAGKQLEQRVSNHQQFDKTFNDARAWLDGAREKLEGVQKTSAATEEELNEQLQKLQELAVHKDEGQSLIHAANTWAERVVSESSPDGQQLIREQLKQLQQDWDLYLANISEARQNLESSRLKWTDYSDSATAVRNWLQDMEYKLKTSELKPDLSDKKAKLQKVKGLHQDVTAYENVVESLCSKGSQLAAGAVPKDLDSEVLQKRYHDLKNAMTEELQKVDTHVQEHVAFNDACSDLAKWIRAAQENLAHCTDTYGDGTALQSKLDAIKELEASLPEGGQKLDVVERAAEVTLQGTAPAGHGPIQNTVEVLRQDYKQLLQQMEDTKNRLTSCLEVRGSFEEIQTTFTQWLTDLETQLKLQLELQPDLESKKQQVEKYQKLADEVAKGQETMQTLTNKAQALLENTADTQLSHSVTQLTAKYQALSNLAKEAVRQTEARVNQHKSYDSAVDEFTPWMDETVRKLQGLHDITGSKEVLQERVAQLKDLQPSLNEGQSKLRSLIDQGELTVPYTREDGAENIKTAMQVYEMEYQRLTTSRNDAKNQLESTISLWTAYRDLFEQVDKWLKDTENKVKDLNEQTDLPNQKSQLEKVKNIQRDIELKEPQVNNLSERLSHLYDPAATEELDNLIERYNQLQVVLKSTDADLAQQIGHLETYRQLYIVVMEWLTLKQQQIIELSNSQGSLEHLRAQADKLNSLKAELADGQQKLADLRAAQESASKSLSPSAASHLKDEVDGAEAKRNELIQAADDGHNKLIAAADNLQAFLDAEAKLDKSLQQLESQVNVHMEGPLKAEVVEDSTIEELQSINANVHETQATLEELTQQSEQLLQITQDPSVSTSIMRLATRFQTLQASAKECQKKMETLKVDQQEYKVALESAKAWLDSTRQKVTSCDDTSGDPEALQARIDVVKDVIADMGEGLNRVSHVSECSQRVCQRVPVEIKMRHQSEVSDLKKEWDKLNLDVNAVSGKLERALSQSTTFDDLYHSLQAWLNELEEQIPDKVVPKQEVVGKKAQLEKYKNLLRDVEKNDQVQELQQLAQELDVDSPEPRHALADIQTRHAKIVARLKEIIADLEKAHTDHLSYRQALQEAEKWIMQMSFKLMTFNALNVSSHELTLQQIEKHKGLVDEIDNFQTSVDQVKSKADHLLKLSDQHGDLASQVEKQLGSLEDSYLSLQATAMQIKVTLDFIDLAFF